MQGRIVTGQLFNSHSLEEFGAYGGSWSESQSNESITLDSKGSEIVSDQVFAEPNSDKPTPIGSKRGQHKYSLEEKIAARKEWQDLDKNVTPTTLEEWLENKFGSESGVLNVAKSTFYGWPKS